MQNLVLLARRFRAPVAIAFDTCAWLTAFVFVAWLRFDSTSAVVPWGAVLLTGAATAALYVVGALPLRLHQGRAGTGSLEEMLLLGAVVAAAGGVTFLVNLAGHWVPRSVPAGAVVVTVVLTAWGRAAWRQARERDMRAATHAGTVRVLVVGAGEAARELIRSMHRDPAQRWEPVGLLDDDPRKRHRRLEGVPMLGTTHDLEARVASTGVETVVIAIPSASSEVINRLRASAAKAGVALKVLPATTELLSDSVGVRDLRDINLTDILGRNQLDTDIDGIAGYLSNRRVLVTGAGGSIGSELCRQIHRFGPSELMMLDRDESALHAVELSIHGRALLDSDEVILCDIRDKPAVHEVFARRRPEVVFHAAALKHLPMLEQYPAEAVKTNVIGTRNVLDASDLFGVETFVNISTDKAANPSSVLGYSKRVAERLTAARAHATAGTYLSVRFGNVLGSRGSVLTAFAKQIAEGGPVTVTHPEVTRYFMTIEEACQLVIQAAAIGGPGEALVLDMGRPVRIVDVAQQLIDQAGRQIRIEFTGLREGEKLHEELFGDDEPEDVRPEHAMVSHVPVPPLDEVVLDGLPTAGPADRVREALREQCEATALWADDTTATDRRGRR